MQVHRRLIVPMLLLGAMIIASPAALAQQAHEHGDEHGHAAPEPQNYREAIHMLNARLEAVQKALDTNQLGGIHDDAEVITIIARRIGRLALAQDSGIAREAVRDVNVAGRDLASSSDRLHEVADDGNLQASLSEFKRMMETFEILLHNLPSRYVCPMHCEPGKTYGAAGACPVCGMHLKKITDAKYSVDVKPIAGSLLPRTETLLRFTIQDPAGGSVNDLMTVHEKLIHLLMVSKDLSWYAHEHPILQADGTFTLPFTFPHAGEFVLFHDFTPPGVGMQVVPVTLHVEGTPPPAVKLLADHEFTRVVDGYTVRLDTHGALSVGNEAVLAYEITRDGRPVTDLEPYLAAMGHLVIISEDLKQFVHSHPLGDDHHGESAHDESGDAREHSEHGGVASGSHSSVVSFHAQFPAEGLYKSWAQFQHRGHVVTVPFIIQVEAGSDHQIGADHHDH